MNSVIRFLLTGLAVLLTAYLLPGVHVKSYGYALLVAIVLGAANAFCKTYSDHFHYSAHGVDIGFFF